MKREVARFDFKAFGQAIKAARKAKGISRNQLADKMNIAPRYIASIENSGQHPSLQIFYELVTLLDVSVEKGSVLSTLITYRREAKPWQRKKKSKSQLYTSDYPETMNRLANRTPS